jgi:hypothetical protein
MDFISLSSAHILTPALENNQTYGREITLLGNSADYNIRTSRNSLADIAHAVDALHI